MADQISSLLFASRTGFLRVSPRLPEASAKTGSRFPHEASSIKINPRELVHGMDFWKSLPSAHFLVLEVYRYRYTDFFPVSTV